MPDGAPTCTSQVAILVAPAPRTALWPYMPACHAFCTWRESEVLTREVSCFVCVILCHMASPLQGVPLDISPTFLTARACVASPTSFLSARPSLGHPRCRATFLRILL